MNYDEAIELENEIKENRLQLTKEKYRDLDDIKLSKIIKSKSDKHDKVINALHYAQKEHELLGLYRRRPLYINSVQFDAMEKQIKLKEKELEGMK